VEGANNLDNERIEASGLNAYELQEQFDTRKSGLLRDLQKQIVESYEGDGERQPTENSYEILEGESASELSGKYGKSGQEKKE
jgi:hypothetical protein